MNLFEGHLRDLSAYLYRILISHKSGKNINCSCMGIKTNKNKLLVAEAFVATWSSVGRAGSVG